MDNKFMAFRGKIYLVGDDEITPIDTLEGIESIKIVPVSREEYLDTVMQKLKQKLHKRREQDIKDKMQEHVAVILHELVHAMHNHPNHEWPWKSFDFVHQTAVMMEEAGEAVRAANNMREKGKWQELYNELAQTAAMCLRVMEQIKKYAVRLDKKDSY